MNDAEKYRKLLEKLSNFASTLRADNRLRIHQKINHFYYLQKTEELKLLLEQLEQAMQDLDNVRYRLEKNYAAVFCQWQKDARWLIQHCKEQI